MSEQEIKEGNELIALFMEVIYSKHAEAWGFGNARIEPKPIKFQRKTYKNCVWAERFEKELKYHSDWNWLMSVVEKIETLDRLGGIVQIVQGQCKITSRMAGDSSVYANKSNYMLMGAKGKLLSTYEAVVEFIKWYNDNK